MAQQNINVGTPNGNNGDFVRNAFIKTNNNFSELYNISGNREAEAGRKGYKILPENFSFSNIPSDYADSIWEIRYNYNLNGGTITLPKNIVLYFNGGYLFNGILNGNNTSIKAEIVKIFGNDITLIGSWNRDNANVIWFGAKGDNIENDTIPFTTAINNLNIGETLYIPPKPYKITDTLEIDNINLRGQGQSSDLRIDLNANKYGIIFNRASDARFGASGQLNINILSNCAGGVLVNYPRFRLSDTRIASTTDVIISDALLSIENSWITTLDNVFCYSPEDVVGLRLSTFSNAFDIIGGEYATGGNPIVVDIARRVNIQTTIEGPSLNRGDGLVINGGDTIRVDSYFEDKGLTINGGERITIGNSSFANDPATIRILGGKNITFDGTSWVASLYPRDAVYIAPGLDNEVNFKQSCRFFDGTSQFVISNSIVNGENVGNNLLIDPFINEWNDLNTLPANFTVSKQGSSTIISRSTNSQIGSYSLRWDANGSATGSQGIFIDVSSHIPHLEGGWATIGLWIYVPEGDNCIYRARLVGDVTSEEQVFPAAAFQAKKNAWTYFSHSKFIDPTETNLRVEIFCLGNKTGIEYFEVDRMILVQGKTSQNIPVMIQEDSDSNSELDNLYLSKTNNTTFSGDILQISNNKNIQFGSASQIRGGSTSGTFLDLLAGDFNIRDNNIPKFTFEKTTGKFLAESLHSTGLITTGASFTDIENAADNVLPTKEWISSKFLASNDEDVTKTISISGSLQAGRYFTLGDYDDPIESNHGIKTYVRDGEWIIAKNDSESNPLKIILSGQEVYHAGNLRSNAENDARYVFPTRAIATGIGLTGGGDLTANRTISLASISAGDNTVGTVGYNSLTKLNGQFYGGNTNPTNITRLNYDGNMHATEFITPSDIRMKKDMIRIEGALEKVNQLNGYLYTMIDTNQNSTGLSAQELLKVLPEAVYGSEEDKYGISYGKTLGLVVEAIKELNNLYKELKIKI